MAANAGGRGPFWPGSGDCKRHPGPPTPDEGMTELQDAAVEYLMAGLHLLALTGKKPNPRVHGDHWSWDDSFWQDGLAPLTDGEEAAVRDAFSVPKGTTGIAILIPENFLVADVDSERAAALLVALGAEPGEDTIGAKTKNGLHVWFSAPGADRNRWLGDGQEPDPGRTLLFKGFGGYVVAPPSAHFDSEGKQDGTYEWGRNPLVQGTAIIMPDILPPSIRERFKMEDQFAATKPDKEAAASFVLVPQTGKQWYLWNKVWTYNTEGLERAIETAADGNQNATIHWAACVALEEGVPFNIAMERLLAAAKRGNHPEQRARATIQGVYKRGKRAASDR